MPGRGEAESLILDTRDAEQAIRRKLERSGVENPEVDEWIRRVDELNDEKVITIPQIGWHIRKPALPQLSLDLSGEFIDYRLLALKALEFLSLLVGRLVYNEAFDPLRNYVLDGERDERFPVERLTSWKYDPFHAMNLKRSEKGFFIYIRLFRWLVFEVEFQRFDYRGHEAAYVEDLLSKKTEFYFLPG